MKILICAKARAGKDSIAEMLQKHFNYSFKSSSIAASEIFLYDALKEKYGYNTPEECFEDRVNHRAEWFELIKEYNKDDPTRLAKEILKDNEIYVGMRSNKEVEACISEGLFDLIIGVYNPNVEKEDSTSFDIDMWKHSDFVIPNTGTLADLEKKVVKVFSKIIHL